MEKYIALTPERMAFYMWDLSSDHLFGDEFLAELFDFDSAELADGLPIKTILSRVVEKDRARIAASIHRAITEGQTYSESYGIVHRDGRRLDVFAFGRCFRSGDGVPSYYTGMVLECASCVVDPNDDPLESHCRSALVVAQQRGKELVSRYLSSALKAMRDVT